MGWAALAPQPETEHYRGNGGERIPCPGIFKVPVGKCHLRLATLRQFSRWTCDAIKSHRSDECIEITEKRCHAHRIANPFAAVGDIGGGCERIGPLWTPGNRLNGEFSHRAVSAIHIVIGQCFGDEAAINPRYPAL